MTIEWIFPNRYYSVNWWTKGEPYQTGWLGWPWLIVVLLSLRRHLQGRQSSTIHFVILISYWLNTKHNFPEQEMLTSNSSLDFFFSISRLIRHSQIIYTYQISKEHQSKDLLMLERTLATLPELRCYLSTGRRCQDQRLVSWPHSRSRATCLNSFSTLWMRYASQRLLTFLSDYSWLG